MSDTAAATYCKAYSVAALSVFPDFANNFSVEKDVQCALPGVYFLHMDLLVRCGPLADDTIVFRCATPQWREFCEESLRFSPPLICG